MLEPPLACHRDSTRKPMARQSGLTKTWNGFTRPSMFLGSSPSATAPCLHLLWHLLPASSMGVLPSQSGSCWTSDAGDAASSFWLIGRVTGQRSAPGCLLVRSWTSLSSRISVVSTLTIPRLRQEAHLEGRVLSVSGPGTLFFM